MKSKGKRTAFVFLTAGVAYFFLLRFTDFGIPCLFRKLTGWLCPGCGITTLIMCLFHLDFAGAYRANEFLFLTGPLLIAQIAYYFIMKAKGKSMPKWNTVLVYLYAASLVLFGVLRNLM